jgi:hypothetical protein
MNKLLQQEKKWAEGYYASAIGLTITGVVARYDEYTDRIWPVLIAVDKNGQQYELELSQDPEGNGPGFMFGLPNYTVPQEVKA